MEIIRGLNDLHKIPKRTVATIGIFDGIHRGHRRIFDKVIRQAKALRTNSLVITFSPHPYKIIGTRNEPPLLVSLRHRLMLMDRAGIDYCLVINFDRRFARMPPRAFVEKILYKGLDVQAVYVGENFHFGRIREGDVGFLERLAGDFGFAVGVIHPLKCRGRIISSSWIREEVLSGNLTNVSRLLGRPFSIYGRVIKGAGRGKRLGFPTANLDIEHEAFPPMGVYAVRVFSEGCSYEGLLNIGHRPTFIRKIRPHTPIIIEVYLLDFAGSLYDKFLEVEFIKRIRAEKKFDKIPSLISAMKEDKLCARRIFSKSVA